MTTIKQKRAEAGRVARLAIGKYTEPYRRQIENAVVVDDYVIRITFTGSSLAPFREARYTAKEVLDMIGLT